VVFTSGHEIWPEFKSTERRHGLVVVERDVLAEVIQRNRLVIVGGDFSDQLNITINDYEPVPLNYFGENITLNYNQTMTPLGGFELRPDLMAGGEDHSCAIKDDGTVRCWGKGANGRLGYGNTNNKLSNTKYIN
jgi:alpha-tubulin suppressor-like RCC1 family protein